MKNSSVRYGCAAQSRKGEEYFIMKTDRQRIHGNPISSFSVFGLLNDGGRLIVASDGIWDALSSEIAAESCRVMPGCKTYSSQEKPTTSSGQCCSEPSSVVALLVIVNCPQTVGWALPLGPNYRLLVFRIAHKAVVLNTYYSGVSSVRINELND
ncbi:hypothetical protein R6Q59_002713 [Mikania micrantha]